MTRDLIDQLQKDYPQLFRELWGDPMETCMAFGIEIGDGWLGLLRRLCEGIMAIGPGPNFRFVQVKEKFGGLRVYCDACDTDKYEAIDKLIDQAEKESYQTCEQCGSKEDVTSEGAWITTLCSKCRR